MKCEVSFVLLIRCLPCARSSDEFASLYGDAVPVNTLWIDACIREKQLIDPRGTLGHACCLASSALPCSSLKRCDDVVLCAHSQAI